MSLFDHSEEKGYMNNDLNLQLILNQRYSRGVCMIKSRLRKKKKGGNVRLNVKHDMLPLCHLRLQLDSLCSSPSNQGSSASRRRWKSIPSPCASIGGAGRDHAAQGFHGQHSAALYV